MTLKQKIEKVIKETLPKDATHTISITRSGVRDTVIVRVLTSAWKSLPSFMRALRIQNALQATLTPSDQQKILRVSVFGPEEIRRTLLYRSSNAAGRKEKLTPLAAKILAKLKQKRAQSEQNNKVLLRALEKLRNAKTS
jgi:hypothetical protein